MEALRGRWTFGLAIILIVCVFAMGGSSRSDVTSLQMLRPLFVIAFGLALMTCRHVQLRSYGFLVTASLLYVTLIVVQSIPLPHGAIGDLPSQRIVSEIYLATGMGSPDRSVTMSPLSSLNSIWALVPPLAIILVSIQLTAEEHGKLLVVVLATGGLSAVIALLQIMGDPEGALYFFSTTNYGSAVGLFANRNHQAALLACLMPIIFTAIYRSNSHGGASRIGIKSSGHWAVMACIAVAVLVVLILISGSRSGVLLGLIGLASITLSVVPPPTCIGPATLTNTRAFRFGIVIALLLALVFAAIWFQRALAIDRMMVRDPSADIRLQTLSIAYKLMWAHQPLGSGFGSFSEVYKIYEPTQLLMAQHMNQVHNDWIDIALAGGVPFVALVAAGSFWLVLQALRIFSYPDQQHSNLLNKAGLAVVVILAVASLSDYPLRTPALACVFALALVWVGLRQPRRIQAEDPASVDEFQGTNE